MWKIHYLAMEGDDCALCASIAAVVHSNFAPQKIPGESYSKSKENKLFEFYGIINLRD